MTGVIFGGFCHGCVLSPRTGLPGRRRATSEVTLDAPGQQGPRNRLRRAAGAAAPSGGSVVHAVTSVGARFLGLEFILRPPRKLVGVGLAQINLVGLDAGVETGQ